MGNDTHFVEPGDLPSRLIEDPVGSAPPDPCPLPHSTHAHHKRHAPPIPPRVAGYDASPPLPSIVMKRADQRTPVVPCRPILPPRVLTKTIPQYPSTDIQHHDQKKYQKRRQRGCCIIL